MRHGNAARRRLCGAPAAEQRQARYRPDPDQVASGSPLLAHNRD